MDAGVPISAPVAGIAMGLIKEGEKSVVLTDILGAEDHLGDMDFKVAGTKEGITALQMDIKTQGLSINLLEEALNRAKEARLFILGLIEQAISEPRAELSQFAPRVISMRIPTDKIGMVIGPGGKVIRGLIEQTGANIDIEDDGLIFITSKDAAGGEQAKEAIEKITKDVVVGEKYLGKVIKIMPFGAFVTILPGKDGLVHISKLGQGRVERVEDVVEIGDEILVEVTEIDRQNRINLKAIEIRPAEAASPPER
jgi:polyribonucleotide nucleotidyltransferase